MVTPLLPHEDLTRRARRGYGEQMTRCPRDADGELFDVDTGAATLPLPDNRTPVSRSTILTAVFGLAMLALGAAVFALATTL